MLAVASEVVVAQAFCWLLGQLEAAVVGCWVLSQPEEEVPLPSGWNQQQPQKNNRAYEQARASGPWVSRGLRPA